MSPASGTRDGSDSASTLENSAISPTEPMSSKACSDVWREDANKTRRGQAVTSRLMRAPQAEGTRNLTVTCSTCRAADEHSETSSDRSSSSTCSCVPDANTLTNGTEGDALILGGSPAEVGGFSRPICPTPVSDEGCCAHGYDRPQH